MRSGTILKAINFLIFLTIIGTPLFYIKQSVYPYTLSKAAFFQAAVEALLVLWLTLIFYDKKYRPRLTPVTKAIIVFLAILFITALLGADPWRSFWSTQERALGVVTIFHFAALTFVLSSLIEYMPWKKILYASLGTSILVGLIAMAQLRIPNLLLEENPGNRPGSTFGNPTFLAGYIFFHILIAIYLLLDNLKGRHDIKWVVVGCLMFASVFSFVALLITQTRGDILALGVSLLTLLLLFVFRPPELTYGLLREKRTYWAILTLIIVLGSGFWFTRREPFWSNVPGLNRFQDLSLESSGLGPRLVAIRAAWDGFLERPILGWGWDNFNIVFNKHYDPKTLEINYQETRFDKPHNFLLEYLVVGGAPLLLSFLILLSLAVFEAWKAKDRLIGQVVIAMIAGYVVRSSLVFDTIGPLLMLYLLLGVVDGEYGARDEEGDRFALSARIPGAGYSFILCGLLVIYLLNFLTVKAAYYQFWGFTYFGRHKIALAIDSFKGAIAVRSPYRWNLKRDYATAVAEAYFYNPGAVPKEEARLAVRAMEEASAEHPLDAYGHYALVDLYNQVSDVDPENYLKAAEREAEIAIGLSPDRQEVYFSLAKTKSLEHDYGAALKLLKYALDLDPNVPDAHFYYGLIAYAHGDADLGYAELKTTIAMKRPWKNFYEPRVVANYFADSGHLDEAIDLYKAVLTIEPGDTDSKVKLGVAYFIKNDRAMAIQYFEDAAKTLNFSKSPAYPQLKPIFQALNLPF